MKPRFFLALSLSALFLIPLSVGASDVQIGKNVSIAPDAPFLENVYVAGGQVNVAATSEKDLTVLGGRIIVTAPVNGDALLLGGTVDLLESVGGDVRVFGGDVVITKPIGGDVLVFGGTVSILPSASVGGDVIVFAGTVDVQGAVGGQLRVYAGAVSVNAPVGGVASIQAGESVEFGEKTVFSDSLTYSAPKEAVVATGAVLGDSVLFTKNAQIERHKEFPKDGKGLLIAGMAILGALILMKFVGMLVAALAVVHTFPRFSLAFSTEVLENFWKSAGIGFVATVVPPIAIIILVISVVGSYLGFILGALYLFGLLIAGVCVGIIAGAFLSKHFKKEVRVNWKWTILGTVVVFALSLIPIVGWILTALLFFASMGAVAVSLWRDAQVKVKG